MGIFNAQRTIIVSHCYSFGVNIEIDKSLGNDKTHRVI